MIHNIIQRVFVLGIAICFMFVAVYVPQTWNNIDRAEAAFATKAGQFMINATNILQLAQDRITSIATVATKILANNQWVKEFISDGFGWWVAKMILSQVTRQIVVWINSGFKGSPAFVQDLEGFALRMADQAAGLYLANLGSPILTQFVCAPFRLNLQIAISAGYNYGRSGLPYGASRCSLTQGMENLDRFTDGSFINGGWNTWYQISSQPLTYTPYGEYLAAKNQLALNTNISIKNENAYLGFGNGFFSNKFCDMVATAATPKEKCLVSTPGQVISESLNFHLRAGSESLVAADEINEILGALLGQLAQTAITGANGLLGMSGNTGYTLPQGVDEMVQEQSVIADNLEDNLIFEIEAQIAREEKYRDAIRELLPLLKTLNTSDSLVQFDRATKILAEAEQNIINLTQIRKDILGKTRPMVDIINQYNSLKNLHDESQINADIELWSSMFINIFNEYKLAVDSGLHEIDEYRPLLVNFYQTYTGFYADEARKEVNLIDKEYKPLLEADKIELARIATDWNNPAIPRIDVINNFIDVKNGVIAPPALINQDDINKKTRQWDDILSQN